MLSYQGMVSAAAWWFSDLRNCKRTTFYGQIKKDKRSCGMEVVIFKNNWMKFGLIILLLLSFFLLSLMYEDKSAYGAGVNIREEMLSAINEVRASGVHCGERWYPPVPPLTWNVHLESAALRHSKDMYDNGFMSHTGSDGSSLGDRLRDAGYSYRMAAENVAWGQRSVSIVMSAWLNSPGHCANIMNADIIHVGAARVGDYWTQKFGAPAVDYVDPGDNNDYIPSPGPPGSGEVIGGDVSVSDAIEVLRAVVGLTVLTAEQEAAADVNQDGKMDVLDAIVILRYVVGLVDSLPLIK